MTREQLEKTAATQGIDLEALDKGMRAIADQEPGSLELQLLKSNLPEVARLQVGCLLTMLVRQTNIDELRNAESGKPAPS